MDLTFGRKAWFPAAKDFGDAIGHVSNYPMAYVYALFLALSGHLIGRRAYIRYATALYPNQYVCLVGPSGLAHKSTAMSLSLESLGEQLDATPPIRTLTTSQGLLTAMDNSAGKCLVVLDEIANMTAKKRQDFAADLLSRIVELYACPRTAGNYTRYDPIEVHNTFLTIISGSTIEWLREGLTSGDLMAGFGNRMTFVLGDPRLDQPWPKAPYFDDLEWDRIDGFQGIVRMDEEARERWDAWYARFYERQKEAIPFTRVMSERVPEKILKCCIVQAAWSRSNLIDFEMTERALDWGRYLLRSIEALAPAFQDAEKQILDAITRGIDTKQRLHGSFAHQFPAKRIKEALDYLKWLGYITDHEGVYLPLRKEETL